MIDKLEALGERLLARLVPRASAAAASVRTCGRVSCNVWCTSGGVTVECYRTCCDNPGRPPSCGSCYCPPPCPWG